MRGGNALRPIKDKKDRWDWRQFWDEDPKRPGKTYAPKAAFLDADLQQFDPLVFGMSPREAGGLDPQQRLLLEVTWEAFEDAGIPIEKISGTGTAVFIGAFCMDHLVHQMHPANRYLLDVHSAAAATMTVLSNRISHVFNLRGPSLTLDTACSSSLVALHYACQSVLSGESEMAIAGGVNVMNRPEFPIMMSKGHFLSDHGECHAFDETAAGYARGEGAGVFLIKSYEKALEDSDPIHAIIRGTGVNQDGHTDGISLPNSTAQEALITDVYTRAGVSPADIAYIEAHGTGTQAGDPAEARALHNFFSQGRNAKLLIGSVKTNIGHLEAVAGVAGLLKAIGILKFRQVPKNLHFKNPNSKIPFEEYCLEVVKENTLLPDKKDMPDVFVGVNSFGYGGTNAHVVLQSAPPVPVEQASPKDSGNRDGCSTNEESALRLIPLSASSVKALRDLAGKLAFQLGQGLPGAFRDLAFTTAFRRSHLGSRCAALARNAEDLREQLIAVSTGEPHDCVVLGTSATGSAGGLVFVFTGMGPQWWAMGQELIRKEQIVADAIEEIDSHFQKMAGWSLQEAMMASENVSRMERTEVAQPANFALQVALTRLWNHYGIRPAAVIGHSVGEVTSAYVAGIYSLEEAVRVSYHRSRVQQKAAGLGAMLAIGLPEKEAEAMITNFHGVSIAAINSFSAVTLSGDKVQLEQIAADLEKREIFQKFLRVEVAYHSPQMDPLQEELLDVLKNLSPTPATLPVYSTVFGKVVPAESWDTEYWWKNVRQSVRFAAGIQSLFEDGYSSFLEIGPHPVLGNSIKECAAHMERNVTCYASLRRKEDEQRRILLTLAELYCGGRNPDWKVLAPCEGRFVPGPQYPWQRERYWIESDRARVDRLGSEGSIYLNRPMLAPRPCWEVEINRNYFPFLFDHGVQDQTVFAGMGYIDAVLSLSQKVHEKKPAILENVSFERVLVVDYSKLQYLVTEFEPEGGRFTISSRVEGEEGALRHCRGRVFAQINESRRKLDLESLKAKCSQEVDVKGFYEDLTKRGLHYGPNFRPTKEVRMGENCYLLRIESPEAANEGHPLHPTIFDAAIQPILYRSGQNGLYVPFSIDHFEYHSQPVSPELYAYGELTTSTSTRLAAHVWLMDSTGHVHAHARHMSLQVIEMMPGKDESSFYYELAWTPRPLESKGNDDGADLLILSDPIDSDMTLADELMKALPHAETISLNFSGNDGLRKEEIAATLSSHSQRKRLIVLWGTKENSGDPLVDSLRLNEKLIGLFKAATELHRDGVDVTLVTRRANQIEGDGELTNWPACAASAINTVAQNEYEALTCRSIDLGENGTSCAAILNEFANRSLGEIAYRNGERFERVLKNFQPPKTEQHAIAQSVDQPFELILGTKGKLDSLHYESLERVEPQEGEVELRIHAVSLNYKDLLKIEGRIHPNAVENTFNESDFGMECAGVITRCGANSQFVPGDRVVTFLSRGFRSYATVPETFVVKIPERLGMEAAAIPVVYSAAYYGLVEVARLQRGERVLIHHATGGLGLAAMDIAHWIGAEVFTTAGSEEKQKFLLDRGIKHVFSSRTLDFGHQIREATNQEGIDVVIGAQIGQAMHVGIDLLRTGGRYIEVGKKDIAEDNNLPLRAFNRNLTFAAVDLDRLAKERPTLVQKTLRSVFQHFADGHFRLGATRIFPAKDVRAAFEEMARNQQIGKLIVDFSSGDVDVIEKSKVKPIIRKDGCYIVTGGTSGFGITTAHWLAQQGAGKIILVSRSGNKAAGMDAVTCQLKSLGAEVEVLSVDVSDAQQVQGLITQANTGSFVLHGVIHGAMVLDDSLLADLTEARFRKVFLPKVAGAFNFANALKDYPSLDFFVFYSSISAVIGNPGQTNYIVANAMLDGFAHALRVKGIPAISINWGALGESGVVARDRNLAALLASSGITGLSNQQAFSALENAIRWDRPQLGVFPINWEKWGNANPKLANDPRFREQVSSSRNGQENNAAYQIRKDLEEASKEKRLRILEDHLQEVLATTLKMSKDVVPLNRKINEMGVDSLMVLELSLGIKERIGINFSAMDFLKGPNLQQLASLAESKLWNN